jgi:spore maturation protein CgeB
MRVVLFYHSLLSDWNNSIAHFLRGISMDLILRGHEVVVYEPRNAWSLQHLLAEHGHGPVARFHGAYPGLASRRYDLRSLELEAALAEAEVVIVHEWCDPALVRAIGRHRALAGSYRLLFHATHPNCLTAPEQMARFDLRHYDGVLAAGSVLREQYLAEGWAKRAWTWHEGADTRLFKPMPQAPPEGDLVWIGNWRDGERAAELHEFLLEPVQALGLRARVYGTGYTPAAIDTLAAAGIEYGGWVPNFDLPQVMARFKVAIHIPPRRQARDAPGLPTGRPFQMLACGRPLVCAVWDDTDGLFQPGVDYGLARDGDEMAGWLRVMLNNPAMAEWMARHGRATVMARHTCAQRVDELLGLLKALPAPEAELAVSSEVRMPLVV